MDKKIQDFFPEDDFEKIKQIFDIKNSPEKETSIKNEKVCVNSRVNHQKNKTNLIQQKELPKRRLTDVLVNKTEGFLMFIITIIILCIVFACSQWNNTTLRNSLTEEIKSLETQIKVLQTQISTLETKLELHITDENKKPIDITLNINGVDKDFTYNPDTGETTEKPNNNQNETTQPTEPSPNDDFDTRPFLGVAFEAIGENEQNPIGLPIDYVYQYSPADFAGMKDGDILMSINGQKISTKSDLDAIMSTLTAEDTIDIQFATTTESGINVINASQKLTYRGNFELPEE